MFGPSYSNPFGNGFNGPERGASYAASSPEKGGVEVAFCRAGELRKSIARLAQKEVLVFISKASSAPFVDCTMNSLLTFWKKLTALPPTSSNSSQKLLESQFTHGFYIESSSIVVAPLGTRSFFAGG